MAAQPDSGASHRVKRALDAVLARLANQFGPTSLTMHSSDPLVMLLRREVLLQKLRARDTSGETQEALAAEKCRLRSMVHRGRMAKDQLLETGQDVHGVIRLPPNADAGQMLQNWGVRGEGLRLADLRRDAQQGEQAQYDLEELLGDAPFDGSYRRDTTSQLVSESFCRFHDVARMMKNGQTKPALNEMMVCGMVCQHRLIYDPELDPQLDGIHGCGWLAVVCTCLDLLLWCAEAIYPKVCSQWTLWDRNLAMIIAVQNTLGGVGSVQGPKKHVWRFLRNPDELIIVGRAHAQAVSLQDGRCIWSTSLVEVNVSPAEFLAVVQGLNVALCPRASLSCCPSEIEEEDRKKLHGDQKHPKHVFYWAIECGTWPRLIGELLEPRQYDGKIIPVKTSDGKIAVKAGVAVASEGYDWLAFYEMEDTHDDEQPDGNVFLYDAHSNSTSIVSDFAHPILTESQGELEGIAVHEQLLIVVYSHRIYSFCVDRTDTALTANPRSQYDLRTMRILTFDKLNTTIALVVHRFLTGDNNMMVDPRRDFVPGVTTFGGVQLHSINSSSGLITDPSHRLYGDFVGVALSENMLVTLSSATNLVQVWALRERIECVFCLSAGSGTEHIVVNTGTNSFSSVHLLKAIAGITQPGKCPTLEAQVGSTVKIHGLQKSMDRNGECGKCVRWHENKCRWQVRIHSNATILVKPSNLKLVDSFEAESDVQKDTSAQQPVHHDVTETANKLSLANPIQEIRHTEVPSHIAPAEAASLVAVQEACFIESMLNTSSSDVSNSMSSTTARPVDADRIGAERLFLIQFHRCPKELPFALSNGLPLKKIRDALEAEGYNWKLPTCEMVFVLPHQYRAAVSAYKHDHKTFSVICSEHIEYLIDESIMHIGKGAWAKARAALQDIDRSASECATIDASSVVGRDDNADELSECCMCVQRTFLHCVPALIDADSVVQSTTESKDNCFNPRRRQCLWG